MVENRVGDNLSTDIIYVYGQKGSPLRSTKNDYKTTEYGNIRQFPGTYLYANASYSAPQSIKFYGHDTYSEPNNDVEYGDDKMDDNKLLELYINKVDKDQAELKLDLRDSEKRIESHISSVESRMDERLNRIEDMINSQNDKIDTVGEKLNENKKFMWGITFTIILSILGSIGTIIAIYLSTTSIISDLVK